jgi:type I restriction enzyme S subunit
MAEQVSSLRTGIKYKNTPIGKIPVDWEVGRLGDLCIGEAEYGANVPSMDKDNNLPRYVRITDITANGKLLESTSQSINKESAQPYILGEGDFLFARSGATVGKSYLYREKDGECAFAGYLIRFKPDSNQLLPEFLFYFTHSDYYYNWVKGILRAGAQPNINAKEYSNMLLPKPPIGEQKGIAEILTTLDEAIEKTDQIVEKIKDVKKSLMQKLLTRGIGHKKFKKSEIGEIPEEWQIEKIADIAKGNKGSIKIGPFGSQLKKSEMVDSGIRVYGQENVYRKNFVLGEYFITHEKFKKLKTVELLPGDVVITMMGTIGDCAVVPEDMQKGIMDSHLMRIQIKGIINPYYLARLIRESLLVKKQIIGMSQGGIMSGLNLSIVKEIKIPVPPMEEQDEIEKIMAGLDIKIENEQTYRSELEEIKKGLMQVLLTGKIRVSA